jgi:hypothetical protein
VHDIPDLDRPATDFAVFEVGLGANGGIQDH